ncbi:MAG: hypothetical protein WBA93_33165 [Microcoleaceae cyanobacterium]
MNQSTEMRYLGATLYPLLGVEKKLYSFRVLKVTEKIPKDNNQPIRLQRWADKLWREELFCPVYPTNRFGYPAFLIPNGNSPPVEKKLEIRDVPNKVYQIELTEKVLDVTIEDAIGQERELVCRMLERPFTDKFKSFDDKFWRSNWTLFFNQIPENEGINKDIVNAYRGLKFRIVYLEGSGFYFAADIRTKYVGKKSLADYTDNEKNEILQEHTDVTLNDEKRAFFLRDNGTVKIPCRYVGTTGKTIDKYMIKDLGKTVYEYYSQNYPQLKIYPHEEAVFVKDRLEKDKFIAVPTSRLFPIFTTEYEGLRKCSIRPQLSPDERVKIIFSFINELSGVEYENKPVEIKQQYLKRERTVFIPPNLEYGGGELHKPFSTSNIPKHTSQKFDDMVKKWSSSKLSSLYRNKSYSQFPFPDTILLYPETLKRGDRETFLNDLKKEIKQHTELDCSIVLQRSYSTEKKEQSGSSLLQKLKEIKSETKNNALIIVVLWNGLLDRVYREIKDTVKPHFSQCVTQKVVHHIVNRQNSQKATSQLQNLALAVFTEVGGQPWVLSNLNHDLHIGIDLLYGNIGYHFFYGTGGRLVDRQFGESISKGRMKEAIKKPELQKRLTESIKTIVVEEGHKINSMIIHRDGRWWPSESSALQQTIKNLKEEKILPENFSCAVVEIRKNHLPVRLFTAVEEKDREFSQNPIFGTYLILDKKRVILSTTGKPGEWDNCGKTANNLLLEIVETIGDFKIQDIAEDAYHLSHLNWNAPNIEIALPVTIRWTDEALRANFHSPFEDEEIEDEDD